MRVRLTLDITRTPCREPTPALEFEHRDTDTAIESTYGGDQRAHRMGFVPDEQEQQRARS